MKEESPTVKQTKKTFKKSIFKSKKYFNFHATEFFPVFEGKQIS